MIRVTYGSSCSRPNWAGGERPESIGQNNAARTCPREALGLVED